MAQSSSGHFKAVTTEDLLPKIDKKLFQRFLKRSFDFIATLSALVLLSPIFLLTAFAVKITSKGPIFFQQTRVGKNQKKFTIYKFRTMRIDAEKTKKDLMEQNERKDGVTLKITNDPRITNIGGFLRKHAIDELPQLFNILFGDMSIVGPRPPVMEEVKKYKNWHLRRLDVQPGLTCFWQVSQQVHETFDDWVKMDLFYIDNWNFWLDLKLIVKTIPVVLTGHGRS